MPISRKSWGGPGPFRGASRGVSIRAASLRATSFRPGSILSIRFRMAMAFAA